MLTRTATFTIKRAGAQPDELITVTVVCGRPEYFHYHFDKPFTVGPSDNFQWHGFAAPYPQCPNCGHTVSDTAGFVGRLNKAKLQEPEAAEFELSGIYDVIETAPGSYRCPVCSHTWTVT